MFGDCYVPTDSLKWARHGKQLVASVEVGKVGIYLQDPVWLDENDSANVQTTALWAKKWLVLHPSDDIMQVPGNEEGNNSRREVPAPGGWFEESKKTIRYSKGELFN
jgi:hypothetical protein